MIRLCFFDAKVLFWMEIIDVFVEGRNAGLYLLLVAVMLSRSSAFFIPTEFGFEMRGLSNDIFRFRNERELMGLKFVCIELIAAFFSFIGESGDA